MADNQNEPVEAPTDTMTHIKNQVGINVRLAQHHADAQRHHQHAVAQHVMAVHAHGNASQVLIDAEDDIADLKDALKEYRNAGGGVGASGGTTRTHSLVGVNTNDNPDRRLAAREARGARLRLELAKAERDRLKIDTEARENRRIIDNHYTNSQDKLRDLEHRHRLLHEGGAQLNSLIARREREIRSATRHNNDIRDR
tara:strand:- start:17865 stop:18458 length:594 start_codon:yes stop_codon:yes gene_type:complete